MKQQLLIPIPTALCCSSLSVLICSPCDSTHIHHSFVFSFLLFFCGRLYSLKTCVLNLRALLGTHLNWWILFQKASTTLCVINSITNLSKTLKELFSFVSFQFSLYFSDCHLHTPCRNIYMKRVFSFLSSLLFVGIRLTPFVRLPHDPFWSRIISSKCVCNKIFATLATDAVNWVCDFLILSPFPLNLSISFFLLHFPASSISSFSPHFLAIRLWQPGPNQWNTILKVILQLLQSKKLCCRFFLSYWGYIWPCKAAFRRSGRVTHATLIG